MTKRLLSSVFLITILGIIVPAQSIQKYADLGNFNLENGQVIKDCKIGYRTFGKLNDDKSNAILFPTWFGGNSEGLQFLIGPGKLADSTKYFVIAVDALGDGVSSSPSNSKLQPNENFPLFNIRDMVNTQYEFVSKILNLKHLFCVMGGSMGGMQTFQWVVSYPDFMNKAVAWVGSPKLTSYDLLLMHTELQAINTELNCNAPKEDIMKTVADITALNITTPEYRVTHTKSADFETFIHDFHKSFSKEFNVYDWRSQLKAILANDVSFPFKEDMKKAASGVKAKMLIIPSLQDHMVNPNPAINFAKMINAQVLKLNNDCGHLAPGCEIDRVNKVVNQFLDK